MWLVTAEVVFHHRRNPLSLIKNRGFKLAGAFGVGHGKVHGQGRLGVAKIFQHKVPLCADWQAQASKQHQADELISVDVFDVHFSCGVLIESIIAK